MTLTQGLADFVVRTSYQDLPQLTIREAKRCLFDWLGVALGASEHPIVDMLLDTAVELGSAPRATVLGRDAKVDLIWAALINGAMSHIHDYDDTHLDTVLHPSVSVIPAILALAEGEQIDGRTLITAIVLGYEVEARVALSVYPSHYDKGWHITGTAGTLGAAAASGKILGLDTQQLTYALGIASTQAAGMREMFGTMCKPFHAGKAAANGLLAALLAKKGFNSSQKALEAPRGFCHVQSDGPDLECLKRDLGSSYEILKNSFKPYPCGVVTHPGIDGVLKLRDTYSFTANDVTQICIRANRLVLELTGKIKPTSGLEGKFSIFHCAAVGLIDGVVGIAQFTDERVRDPEVVSIINRVKVEVDPLMNEDEAIVSMLLRDGRKVQTHVVHASGSRENPLSEDDLKKKFKLLVQGILSAEQIDLVVRLIKEIEEVKNVKLLVKACST
ncbi:MAG: MmgE/PrpD family protein [Bacillota bacterium]